MSAPAALLLYPGAGTTSDHPSLLTIDGAWTGVVPGALCRRADFPYRRAGRRAPDRPGVLVNAVRAEASEFAAACGVEAGDLVLGGRSMGGRMCSVAVAGPGPGSVDDLAALPARALVLISYPLHPPGTPERLRVEHFERLHLPCLFVHGTRDPFGTPEELLHWTARIPGPVTHVWIDGGRHELKGADAEVADAVASWCQRLT
jgi:hypothetical protein